MQDNGIRHLRLRERNIVHTNRGCQLPLAGVDRADGYSGLCPGRGARRTASARDSMGI